MKILHESLPRPRLSVAMIVRNEQEVLGESLESARPVADEMVVFDTGSTDQTVAIARRLDAAVHRGTWTDDFSAARNQCLRFVTGDWVLWLNAGERIASESAVELRRFVDEKAPRDRVHGIEVETPPRDPDGPAELVVQPRLMPTGTSLSFEGRVREVLRPANQGPVAGFSLAPGRILRHARQHDPAQIAAKAERNLALVALEAADSGWSPRLFLAAGEARSALGDLDEARGMFRQAILAAPRGSGEMLAAYYGLLTAFDGDVQFQNAQLAACVEGLEVFPFDLQLLLAMGNYMVSRQRFDLAARAFDAAVQFGKVTPEVSHLDRLQDLAAACLNMARRAHVGHQTCPERKDEVIDDAARQFRIDQGSAHASPTPQWECHLPPEENSMGDSLRSDKAK